MNVVGGELDLNLQHAAERIARAAREGAQLALLTACPWKDCNEYWDKGK